MKRHSRSPNKSKAQQAKIWIQWNTSFCTIANKSIKIIKIYYIWKLQVPSFFICFIVPVSYHLNVLNPLIKKIKPSLTWRIKFVTWQRNAGRLNGKHNQVNRINNVENMIRDPVILGEIISGVFCMSANAAIGIPHTKTGPLLLINF